MADERYLLVQLADIGDLALTTPAIAALRAARPSARLELFASEPALPLMPEGLIDKAIPFKRPPGQSASRAFFTRANLRQLLSIAGRQYDAVVFFHHFSLRAGLLKFWLIAKASGARRVIGLKGKHGRFLTDYVLDEGFGARHQAQYWLDLVALLGASAAPRPAQVRRAAFSHKALESDKPKVVIHAGSGGYSLARRWPPAHFAAVARQLKAQYDAQITIVGQPADDGQTVADSLDFAVLNLVGQTNLPQLAQVIAQADLFIGADSGVMHIAAATGTPVLSIFGASNAAAWRPWTLEGRAEVLRSGVACSPCSYVGLGIGARAGCAARTCMKLVSPAQVYAAAGRLLDKESASLSMSLAGQPAKDRQRLSILGLPVDTITYKTWLEQIEIWLREKQSAKQVCTVNPEFIMIAQRDPIFFHILQRAALCVPDGVGLLWASRYLGAPLPERVTGSDGLPLIAEHAAERGWKIFFLGAGAGIAARAATILQARYPGLQVVGTHSGSPAADEEDAIVALINKSGADILFVAYGAPKQDKWIARNLPRLQVGMAMGVGGSFDFIAGTVPRAPEWLQKRGLEWLYRLLRQPWRWRRMLRLPRFVLAVLWRGQN